MLRGFYTAASGLVTHENRLNVHGNNLANVSTAGFKKDGLIVGTFGEHMAVRMNAYEGRQAGEIGPGVFMATTVDEFTDHTQGAYDETGRALDVGLSGPGYFVLRGEEGEFLTRDGQFALDEEGYLVLPGYGRVQGEAGDIQLESSRFSIAGDGTISLHPMEGGEEPEEVDRLLIVLPQEGMELKKTQGGELFTVGAYLGIPRDGSIEETAVMQGILERSNVNVAEEMSQIIANQRGFQSCSQIVKMYDKMAEEANNRLTRIG